MEISNNRCTTGLLYSLGVLISGPIWAAEWGVPWDFQDIRLNSFAVLAGVALFFTLGEMNSEDTQQKMLFSSVGIFGFGLVPLTYMATRWWQERHPGPLIGGGNEDSGVRSIDTIDMDDRGCFDADTFCWAGSDD